MKWLVVLVLVVFMSGGVLADWSVWVDHSVKKYRQDGEDGTSGANSLSVKMAKNEFESFQVFVYADGEDLSGVDVSVSDFVKGGDVVDDIYLYKEWYVECSQRSRVEYETGSYPDALLPKVDRFYHETRDTFPFDVSSGKVQGVWVDIGTEASSVPGVYSATVRVSADGKEDVLIPISLEVWDFGLPSTSGFPANYLLRANAVSFGHGYEANVNTFPSKEIISKYMDMFLYHRTVPVIRGDAWSVSYTWDNDTKTLTINDYNPWESWLIPGMGGLAISSGTYAGARFSAIHTSNPDRPNLDNRIPDIDKRDAVRQYYQQQYDESLFKGWDPIHTLYNSVIDEPNCDVNKTFRGQSYTMCEIADIQASDSKAIDTHGAGIFKNVFVHSINQLPHITDFENYGFYAPQIATQACPSWDRSCSHNTASGGSRSGYKDAPYWSYLGCSSNGCRTICGEYCTGAMDSSVDANAMYNRVASFYRYLTRATGSFFWGSVVLNYANDVYYTIWSDEYKSNGDGHLLYPGIVSKSGRTWNSFPGNANHAPEIGGIHDIPIASMRWKYIRDQQEDLEYFKLAEESTSREVVLAEVDRVFDNVSDPRFAYWNLNMNPDDLFLARENVANLISPEVSCENDNDGDSYGTGGNCLGLDCDDLDSSVHTLLNCSYDGVSCGNFSLCVASCLSAPMEVCGNGVDEDCDGFDLNCSFHEADLDFSGVVETSELVAFVDRWKVGEVGIDEVMEVVVLWVDARG